MSTNATTIGTQAPTLIPEVWSLSLNKKLDKTGVGMKIVTKQYEKDIKSFGDTVHINDIGDVTIVDYDDEDGMSDAQRVTSSELTLKLDQQKAFNMYISDVTMAQSNIKDLEARFKKRAQVAIDLVRDTFVLGAFADIPADNKLSTVKLTSDNAYDTFVDLAKVLKNNNAIEAEVDEVTKSNQAEGSMPWVVINADVEAVLLKSPNFIHATQKGDMVLRKGSIGSIAGLDILRSSNLPTVQSGASGSETYTVNIMAGINDAIAYAGNVSKIEVIRDQKRFGNIVRGLYVYGKKTILPKALSGISVTL